MWALQNRTPYAAERTWVRDKQGVHHWIVCVRATFDLSPDGKVTLAEEQTPPVRSAEYTGEPGKSSVRYEADLTAMKPGTDVTVLGSAYAPGGRPAESVPVGLRVADVQKVLVVHGPRVYVDGTRAYRPAPFVTQRMSYEEAYGGMDVSDPDPARHRYDSRNPIGRGFAVRKDGLAYRPAHTVAYPSGDPARTGPAGFGPLASYWTPRLQLAGTYDTAWEARKKPLLPDDYDESFVMCSPRDQRVRSTYLLGGELMEVVNMTPEGLLRFALPSSQLRFETRVGGRWHDDAGRLVTVIVETSEQRLSMVWQTARRVAARQVESLDATRVAEKS